MFKKWTAPALVLATVVAGPALAEDDGGWLAEKNFTGNVALTSDYVYRGVSQTDSNPAIQGGLDYASPVGLYLGTWASNVAFGGGVEIDWYGGYAGETSGFGYDVGAIYYSYPKSRDGAAEFNFWEGYVKLGYTLSLGAVEPALGVGYSYSPDYFGEDGKAHYVNGNVSLGLPYDLSLGAEVGYQKVEGDKVTGNGAGLDGDDGFDFVHYRVGLGYSVKGIDLDLSYHNTTESEFLNGYAGYQGADNRFVFTVSRSL